MIKYQVIRDSREQDGWTFPVDDNCEGTVVAGLKTGDYTLKGFEKTFVIERKGCVSEFATNLMEDRFERELERLDSFLHPFIILEFQIENMFNFPKDSGIPLHMQGRIKVKPKFLIKRLNQILVCHKTKVIFAGDYGRWLASSIFKRIVENGIVSS